MLHYASPFQLLSVVPVLKSLSVTAASEIQTKKQRLTTYKNQYLLLIFKSKLSALVPLSYIQLTSSDSRKHLLSHAIQDVKKKRKSKRFLLFWNRNRPHLALRFLKLRMGKAWLQALTYRKFSWHTLLNKMIVCSHEILTCSVVISWWRMETLHPNNPFAQTVLILSPNCSVMSL